MTPEPHRGYWQTGGPLIRIALVFPPIVGLLLGAAIASLAMESTATGLDPANRGWFFLMVPPAQLGTSFMATTYLASVYFGVAALPAWVRRAVPLLFHALNLQRPDSDSLDRLSLPRKVITAVSLAISGTIAVLLAVPVQVLLTTWLTTRPDLYSDVEKVIVGVETAAVAAWLAYLVRGLWRHRSRRFPPH